jgi:hypothetical protein
MGKLEDLAQLKFPDPPLSAAEERVVRAAPDGTVADCRDLGGGDDPEKADGAPEAPDERWPDTRNVRADLIRWLCVDREARELVDPKGVWIRGARIKGRLDLNSTNVLFPLFLWSCRLEQNLHLNSAKMPLLSLEGSWTGSIAADGLNLEGSLFLRNGFHAEGEVSLIGATIGGDLEAEGGAFKRPSGNALNAGGTKNETALNAERIKVGGNIFLSEKFVADGTVQLRGATIGGDLIATGGTFKNSDGDALSADGIKVHGKVVLRDKFLAAGQVVLIGAEITGQLAVGDAWLDALVLESAQITGSFFWQNIHKDPHPDFPNKEWKPSLYLTAAKVGSLVDQEASWPEKGRLFLDGFVYDRIVAGPTDAKAPTDARVPIDAKTRLKWLHLQPDELGFRPQPYEQLIAVLRRMGHEHQVAEVAIAKQKDLYEHGDLGWWGKVRSWFLYLVVGYGYEPWRAFGWMAMLVLLGTLVFWSGHSAFVGVMVPSENDAYQSDQRTEKTTLPYYYPEFHPLVYSLDVIFPFDLGQKSSWRLIERWPGDCAYWGYESYSLFQLVVGWMLLLVAAAVPAGFIKKD